MIPSMNGKSHHRGRVYAGRQPAQDPKSWKSKCQGSMGRGRGEGQFHGGLSGNLGEPCFSYGRSHSPSKTSEADLKSPTPPGEPSLSPVAGSIFRPLSQTHISKSEFKQSCAGTLPYQGTIQKGTLRYKVP